MSKVFLGVGHGGADPGAVGYVKEADVNLNMALACKEYLEANGVEVKMSRTRDENDDLKEEVAECNAFNPDLAVDIHNNAGRGDGFEVYHSIYRGVGTVLAQNIEAEVKAIGQNSRGCKSRQGAHGDYYGFIRGTKAPSVICEGVFVDNQADAAQADTLEEQRAFGVAYAKGILKTLGISTQVTPPQINDVPSNSANYLVKVLVDTLNVRANSSTDSAVVTQIHKNEIYTIVEERVNQYGNKWGKLKSGAGWISLSSKYVTTNINTPTPSPKPVAPKRLTVGSKVKVKGSAGSYCTGQKIPDSVKGKTYTVAQVSTKKYPNGVLLKEIMSWINNFDLEY